MITYLNDIYNIHNLQTIQYFFLMIPQQIDYPTIIALFQATFSASDTNTIKQSQKTLWDLACNQQFPSILHMILDSNTSSREVKNAVAVYLKKLSNRYCKQQSPPLLSALMEVCWKVLIGKQSIKIKSEISVAIENIVKNSPVPFMVQIIEIINKELAELPNEFDVMKLEAVVMIANRLLNVEIDHLQKIGIAIINVVVESYSTLLGLVGVDIQNGDDAAIGRKILTAVQINKLLLKHLKLGDFMVNKEYVALISKNTLASALWSALQLRLPVSYAVAFQLPDNTDPTFTNYNILRSTTINIIIKILLKLKFLGSQFGPQITEVLQGNPVYKMVVKEVEHFKFIVEVLSMSNTNSLPLAVSDCLKATLRLLTTLLMDSQFESFFLTNKQTFINQLILPLLSLKEKQFEDYVLDPEEFINYLFHSMPAPYKFNPEAETEEESDMILTGYVSQFLIAYCIFQHGTLVEIFTACSENLLKGKQEEKQLALIVLGSLMTEIGKREDLMEIVNVFVNENIRAFVTTEQDRHTKTLRLYLGYKYMVIFAVKHQVTAVSLLELSLIILEGTVKKNQCIELMSIELIRDLINYGTIMCSRFEEVLSRLTALVNTNSHHKITELINSIISDYFKQPKFNNQQLVMTIVHQMIVRIQKQCTSEIPNADVRNRCWNILKTISYNPKFGELSQVICREITTLYPFLDENLGNIDFEEDIIIIISFFIRHSKRVTKEQFMILKYFKPILSKNGNTMGELFLPTCLILTYGVEWLAAYPNTINDIIEICVLAITAQPSTRIGEPEHLQGIVTLQSVLISCQDHLTPDIISKLFTLLFTKFFAKYKLQQLKQNIINCLGLLLYKAVPIMTPQDSEKTLTILLCNHPQSCKSIYTLKTYVIALCQLLHLLDYDIVRNRVQTLLNILVDSFQMLVMTKDEIIDPDEEISEDEHEYEIFVEKELVNKITITDELAVVKQTIEYLVQKHGQLLGECLKTMLKERADYLRSLSSSVNVDNKPRQIVKVNRKAIN